MCLQHLESGKEKQTVTAELCKLHGGTGGTQKGMTDRRDRKESKGGGGARRERAGRLGSGCLIVHVPSQRERRKRKLTCTEKLFCVKTFCVEVFNSLNHS